MEPVKSKGIDKIMNTVHDMYRSKGIANMVEVPQEFLFHRENGSFKPQERNDGDYVGCVDGVAVAVSVITTIYTAMHGHNFQQYQIDFLRDWEKCGGKAFLLLYYVPKGFAVTPFSKWEEVADGMQLSDIPTEARIRRQGNEPVDYMKAVKWFLAKQ